MAAHDMTHLWRDFVDDFCYVYIYIYYIIDC